MTTPYQQGYDDFCAGEQFSDFGDDQLFNPFEIGTDYFYDWNIGWWRAARDHGKIQLGWWRAAAARRAARDSGKIQLE